MKLKYLATERVICIQASHCHPITVWSDTVLIKIFRNLPVSEGQIEIGTGVPVDLYHSDAAASRNKGKSIPKISPER